MNNISSKTKTSTIVSGSIVFMLALSACSESTPAYERNAHNNNFTAPAETEEENAEDAVEEIPDESPTASDESPEDFSFPDFPDIDTTSFNFDIGIDVDDISDFFSGVGENIDIEEFEIPDFNGEEPDNLGDPNEWQEGYDRAEYFPTWRDVNDSGCDARQDVLARDMDNVEIASNGCTVMSGDYYDYALGEHIHFENDGAGGSVDIDHLVPINYAVVHGDALNWSEDKRIDFANNEVNLLAMDASTNRHVKSDKGPSEWMPADEAFHCDYGTQFLEVATVYGIDVPQEDVDAVNKVC